MEMLKKNKKTPTISYDKLFSDFRSDSEIQITGDMYKDALRDLQDQNFLAMADRNTIRINLNFAPFPLPLTHTTYLQ